MSEPNLPETPAPEAVDPIVPLPEDAAAVQTKMFEEHPEMDPAFGSPEIEPVEGEAGAAEELYEHEPLWDEGGDLAGALEALLTAGGEVMDIARLRDLTGLPEGALRMGLEKLSERLQPPSGLRLVEVGGGWRMATAPHYQRLVSKLVTTLRSGRLTPAQTEVLAIVAYRQPITITEINDIRGVTSSANQIKSLLERELITLAGRKAVVGRPMMYATTQNFLVHFGLKGLHDLPRLADFGEGNLEATALAQLEPLPEDSLFDGSHDLEASGQAAPEEASAPPEDAPDA
ncbi:MAG: SMC-Scp complex subunit ScpB [Holophagaceae bacterium]